MIISLTCINSVMVYLQTVFNAKNKKKWVTPFIFIFFIFFEWCLFNFFILNYGVNYQGIYDGFICLYALGTSGFLIYYLWKWRFWLSCKLEFGKQLPILFALLFITIFFIFYQKGYAAEQSDTWFYYQMMNYLHSNGNNYFQNSSLLAYNRYLNVGIYQLGASLSLPQRLFIFPYFTTYIYFFIIFTTTYEVLSYFLTNIWKKNIIFFLVLILFLFLYWFCNLATYTILIGNIESSFLLTIVLLPSFMHFKNANAKYVILFLFIGYLFYNETSILVELFYFIAYLGFILIFKQKYHISLLYYLSALILFVLPLYLFIYDYLTLFENVFQEHAFAIFLIINIVVYCECIYWISTLALKKLNFKFISNSRIIKWVNEVWNNPLIENKFNNLVSSKKTKLYLTISFSILIDIFVIFSVFDLGFTSNVSVGQWIIAGFLCAFFLASFNWIIFKHLYSPFFIYFCFLLAVVFILHCFALGYHHPNVWVLQRVTYIGLFPTYVQEGLIHDLVLLTYFILSIIPTLSFKWINKWLNKKTVLKTTLKHIDIELLTVACIPISIIVPSVQAGVYSTYYLTLQSSTSTNLLGLTENSWLELQQINFKNQLVFSDFYLPIANDTLSFNISHINYPAYGNIVNFYDFKLPFRTPLKEINGTIIKEYNSFNFTTNILPYYNWIVIKANDKLISKILKDNNQMYQLYININNQLLIYKNVGINQKLQTQFIRYNPCVFKETSDSK